MKRITWMGLLLVAGLAPPAYGEQIRWGYDWMAFPGEVPVGQGKVAFSDEPYRTAAGSTRVVAANLSTFSTASAGSPDLLGPNSGYYAMVMGVQDLASGQWGALFFQGQLQGQLTQSSSALTNRIIGPTTQSLEIGNTVFTVSLDSFTPPGAPGSDNRGSLGAYVEVAPANRETPEPSSLVLAGLALAAGGVGAWRRRRRSA